VVVAKPGDIDRSGLFDEDPRHAAIDLDLRSDEAERAAGDVGATSAVDSRITASDCTMTP
jgi:hypothetical protein